jgi:ketosteroid isomerase-like protein
MLSGLACAFLLAMATNQVATKDSNHELTEMPQRLARAWLAGDRIGVENIIASDWTLTGPDGRVSTRADVLRDVFVTRTHRIIALTVDDVHARVFGDAAVVTGRTHGRGESANTPYDVVIRFTDVFIRRDGRWQAVASHASLLTSKPSTHARIEPSRP